MRFLPDRRSKYLNRNILRALIRRSTEICKNHLTPEVKLCLITPSCPLWVATLDKCPFNYPFWGFYWPGGQVLSRYILDNKSFFENKYVIDIGSGCGACALAALASGAKSVIANDIDPVACEAISINSNLNGLKKVHIYNKNLIGDILPFRADVILVGDMFYDADLGELLFNWLINLKQQGIKIFIGDPGRYVLDRTKKSGLKMLKECYLGSQSVSENNGFKTSIVWEIYPHNSVDGLRFGPKGHYQVQKFKFAY